MEVKLIKTKKDYQEALKRLELIFDAKKNTPAGDELELLGILIDHYERIHFPMEYPDPIEAIKFRMEQLGYTQGDFASLVGSTSRASEILNKKRKLTLDMIRGIQRDMHIPSEVLIQ